MTWNKDRDKSPSKDNGNSLYDLPNARGQTVSRAVFPSSKRWEKTGKHCDPQLLTDRHWIYACAYKQYVCTPTSRSHMLIFLAGISEMRQGALDIWLAYADADGEEVKNMNAAQAEKNARFRSVSPSTPTRTSCNNCHAGIPAGRKDPSFCIYI